MKGFRKHSDAEVKEILLRHNFDFKKAAKEIGFSIKYLKLRVTKNEELHTMYKNAANNNRRLKKLKVSDEEIIAAIKKHNGHFSSITRVEKIPARTLSYRIATSKEVKEEYEKYKEERHKAYMSENRIVKIIEACLGDVNEICEKLNIKNVLTFLLLRERSKRIDAAMKKWEAYEKAAQAYMFDM